MFVVEEQSDWFNESRVCGVFLTKEHDNHAPGENPQTVRVNPSL